MLKPLGDRVVIRVLEQEEKTASGIFLPDTAKEKPSQGEVVAVGPGKVQDDGKRVALDVKVGDKIIDAKCNESILCALERAGVRVNVCCRSGECSLCRVKLVSGKVFMPRGVLLRHADEMFGYIHSCKAYPIGDVEIAL